MGVVTRGVRAGIRDPRRACWLMAVFLVVVDALLVLAVGLYPTVAREHGPMENLQAAGLVLASLVFAGLGWRGSTTGGRRLAWLLALFCFTFFLLEFDTRPFGVAPLTALTNGPVRDAWLLALWLLAGGAALRRRREVWGAFRGWVASVSGWHMVAAGGFWMLSRAVEGSPFGGTLGAHFPEELMEVNAVTLMLAAALLARSQEARGPDRPASDTR